VSDAIFARVLFTLADRRAISATIVGAAGDAPGYSLQLYTTKGTEEVLKNDDSEYTVKGSKGKNRLGSHKQLSVTRPRRNGRSITM